MQRRTRAGWNALAVASVLLTTSVAGTAGTIPVHAGESIQAAIVAATSGDVITVAPGIYAEDIDFLGKAVTVVGAGLDSVVQGTGRGPVVTFSSGEGTDSVLDSLTITGGLADLGGGLHIAHSSPRIVRNVIYRNAARLRGSGIYVTDSHAEIRNNVVLYNHASAPGDPHSIEIVGAAPAIVNNTIVRGDSNGILLRGDSPALVMNNVIAENGSSGRGRGICDFSSGGSAVIAYNLFWRNRVAALLTDQTDFRRVAGAEQRIGAPRLLGNVDGNPELVGRQPLLDGPLHRRTPVTKLVRDLIPSADARRRRALDAGNPDPSFADLDGTRNDLGFTGGPDASLR
jgi:hypothetical protein